MVPVVSPLTGGAYAPPRYSVRAHGATVGRGTGGYLSGRLSRMRASLDSVKSEDARFAVLCV